MPDRDYDSDLDDAMTPTIPAEQDTPQHTTMVQFLPPVTSMPTPPTIRPDDSISQQRPPTTTILIDTSQEE